MSEIVKAAIIIAVAIVSATAIQVYWSPYSQCVRGKAVLNQNSEMVVFKYPVSSAQLVCAEAIGHPD